jgi:hypothetical protein
MFLPGTGIARDLRSRFMGGTRRRTDDFAGRMGCVVAHVPATAAKKAVFAMFFAFAGFFCAVGATPRCSCLRLSEVVL